MIPLAPSAANTRDRRFEIDAMQVRARPTFESIWAVHFCISASKGGGP